MIWWFFACAAPRWTPEAVLAPEIARLDADHDGTVSRSEYERAAWNGPPFATADADGSGDLSVGELLTLFRTEDAVGFDHPGGSAAVSGANGTFVAAPAEARNVAEVITLMADALRAAGDPGPDPQAVFAAVHSGRIDSVETRLVLDTMRLPWLSHGWAWPAGLP